MKPAQLLNTCAVVAALVVAAAGCRTPGSAGTRVASSDAAIAGGAAPGGTTWAVRFGVELSDAEGGVRVVGVAPVSPGCVMGLSLNDTIVAVNGVDVDSTVGFERAALANFEKRFSPWCFTIKQANGAAAKVPMDCNFAALRQDPAARRYLCDAADMGLCGPLTERCMDPAAKP